jgi:FAS-associated factor 2
MTPFLPLSSPTSTAHKQSESLRPTMVSDSPTPGQSSATQRRTTSTISNGGGSSSAAAFSSVQQHHHQSSSSSDDTNNNVSLRAPPLSSTVSSTNNNNNQSVFPIRLLLRFPAILTILLRVAMWPLVKILNVIFSPKEFDGVNNSVNADRAARMFVGMIRQNISTVRPAAVVAVADTATNNNPMEQYDEPSCPFTEKGYNSTMDEITNTPNNNHTHNPLLLIYLHSPLHSQSTQFIQNYICHPQLLKLLNDNTENGVVKCFGTSVHSADGQRLRDMMEVTSFPFMALLSVKSSSSSSSTNNNITMELLLRLESSQLFTIQPTQITTYLNTAITRHAQLIAEEIARRIQREEDARLREEQNREYQEALLADQMRELERNQREEMERKERMEEEERRRMEVVKEQSRLEVAKSIMERSGGEPSLGTKVGVTRMRFTLPNGKKVDRRFHSLDTVEVIRAFLTLHFDETGVDIKNFGLSTNFPKKTFGEEDNKLTLEEAGLAPQAVVMVQDLDA